MRLLAQYLSATWRLPNGREFSANFRAAPGLVATTVSDRYVCATGASRRTWGPTTHPEASRATGVEAESAADHCANPGFRKRSIQPDCPVGLAAAGCNHRSGSKESVRPANRRIE